jgi:translation initiation factor 3 subunit M
MTTLLELEPTATVAKSLLDFVKTDAAVVDACKNALKENSGNGNYIKFVSSLLSKPDVLFQQDDQNDVLSIFNIVSHLVCTRVPDGEQAALVKTLTATVTASADNTKTRLRILVALYNLMSANAACSSYIAKELLKYATENGHVNLISQGILTIVSQVEAGGAAKEDVRDVMFAGHLALEDYGSADEAQQLLVRYLATFEGESAESMGAIKERAAKGVVGAIKVPFVSFTGSERSRVSTFSSVKQLKDDATYAPLYRLLTIFMEGSYADYMEFLGEHKAAFGKYGFEEALCTEKMRLLSLCSIASGVDELQYSAVARELQVEEADVEDWVIRGIMEDLIEAKLDQVEKLIIVNRVMPRTFGGKQWEGLGAKLNDWKSNVRQLLAVVQAANVPK